MRSDMRWLAERESSAIRLRFAEATPLELEQLKNAGNGKLFLYTNHSYYCYSKASKYGNGRERI